MNLVLLSADDLVLSERISSDKVLFEKISSERVSFKRASFENASPDVFVSPTRVLSVGASPSHAPANHVSLTNASPIHVSLRDQRRVQHILQVHKAQVGEQLKVGLINGLIGSGTILSATPQEIQLQVSLHQHPPAALPLTLILALPRPKMLKRILQNCATLGVKKLILINSYRVEKSYWQTPILEPANIHEHLVLGLEQGGDTYLPEVRQVKRFKPFVEDELPTLVTGSRALVAHPYTETACPRNLTEPVTLAIGPEGGFIPYEIDLLTRAGFQAVHLGERILRVDTTIPFIVSRLF